MKLRRRKKSLPIEGELSLFSDEHWAALEDDTHDSAAPAAPPATTEAATVGPEQTATATKLWDDMRWAVSFLRLADIDTARLIAMETSMIVQSSYHPDHLYVIRSMQGERMSGQRVSALCYASFMRAFPGMVDHLNFNYYDLYQAVIADDQ